MKIAKVSWLLGCICLLAAQSALARPCGEDRECKKGLLCHASKCVKLSSEESLADILLAEWVPNAKVYIDDVPMGDVPWEGIVSAGQHTIRIEAPGYEPVILAGQARPAMRETIEIRMTPLGAAASPAPAPAPMPAPAAPMPAYQQSYAQPMASAPGFYQATDDVVERSKKPKGIKTGMLYVGLLGSAGYGTMNEENIKRPAGWIGIGGTAGARLLSDPVWLDLGAAATYGKNAIKKWPNDAGIEQDSSLVELRVGVLPRLLFSLFKNFYLGAELELGFAISSLNFFYLDVRADLAFVLTEYLEIRVNPAGFEFLKNGDGYSIMGYTATAGVAFRFLQSDKKK